MELIEPSETTKVKIRSENQLLNDQKMKYIFKLRRDLKLARRNALLQAIEEDPELKALIISERTLSARKSLLTNEVMRLGQVVQEIHRFWNIDKKDII